MNKNMLVLAYLGDSIYEMYVRKYLVDLNIPKVNMLQSESIKYVSAKAQASFLKEMMDINFFNDEELSIIIRARNHKNNHKPKNCDIVTYKYATALEALIGYLYYNDSFLRINEIMNYIINKKNKD